MHGLPCAASGGLFCPAGGLLLPCGCHVSALRGIWLAGGGLFPCRWTFRTQTGCVWRCAVCWRCIIPRAAYCCRVACVWALIMRETWGIMLGGGHPPPPWGHPCGGAAFLRIFFYFFLGGGVWAVGAWSHGMGVCCRQEECNTNKT